MISYHVDEAGVTFDSNPVPLEELLKVANQIFGSQDEVIVSSYESMDGQHLMLSRRNKTK